MNSIKKIFTILFNFIKDYQIAPIVSGGAALWFLREVIFSNLPSDKYLIAILAVLVLFGISVILYYLLSKLEKDKDVYLISSVGKVVEDIFAKYGVAMASSTSPGSVGGGKMNRIMQTIISHLKEMLKLADKKYTN